VKDFKDLTSIVVDHDIGTDDGETINGSYLAKLCAGDWGAYKTFTRNLTTLETMMEGFELTPSQLNTARKRVRRLADMIEREPKSLGWKMRARLGEKVPWYELPESNKSVVVNSFD
jgi:hypothetical protein